MSGTDERSVRVSSSGGASLEERQLLVGVFSTAQKPSAHRCSFDGCVFGAQTKTPFLFFQQLHILVGVALDVLQADETVFGQSISGILICPSFLASPFLGNPFVAKISVF